MFIIISFQHVDLHSIKLNLLQLELEYSAYDCYCLQRYKMPKKLIEEVYTTPDLTMPPVPSARIMMRVRRIQNLQEPNGNETKEKEVAKPPITTIQTTTKIGANMKVKMPQNMQFFHQGQIKGRYIFKFFFS